MIHSLKHTIHNLVFIYLTIRIPWQLSNSTKSFKIFSSLIYKIAHRIKLWSNYRIINYKTFQEDETYPMEEKYDKYNSCARGDGLRKWFWHNYSQWMLITELLLIVVASDMKFTRWWAQLDGLFARQKLANGLFLVFTLAGLLKQYKF